MEAPKKGKLIGGIVLAAFGVIGLGGISGSDHPGWYFILCLIFMGGGLALILAYVKTVKSYNASMQEQNARARREQELKDAQRELERKKVDAELQKLNADATRTRVCPHCGGSTRGDICEYCGSRLS